MTNKLWNKNFTLITMGSVVSLIGSSFSNFAMGLLILDTTKSTFMYSMYLVLTTLATLIMPIVVGPFIDRYSRRKIIYTLDFFCSILYLIEAVIFYLGTFSYTILIIFSIILSAISSIYYVAYESFYPMLIDESNYSKAYSIDSTLKSLSMIMLPISAFVYNLCGVGPILIFDGVTFLISALLETKIKIEESYAIRDEKFSRSKYKETFKEGIKFLKLEKGLLAITIYFAITMFSTSAEDVLLLPFFKKGYVNGEYIYMYVMFFMVVGRVLGGSINYKMKIAKEKKYKIAVIVYITISALEGMLLFVPVCVMKIFQFLDGILGITSYSIRSSATQSYVDDEMKGRFNGVFQMLTTFGSVSGQFMAGVCSELISEQYVLLLFMIINFLAVFAIILRKKSYIKPIYNR